jgi:lipopolysaccharide/colanic/teichoic acid biosynthesis glycosyltransferase
MRSGIATPPFATKMATTPSTIPPQIWKTCFLYPISCLFCICSLPLILVIGICLGITHKTPILFCQPRIGRNGKQFLIYKFRTLEKSHPEKTPSGLQKNNGTITAFGNFLRKSSLDELPQIFNILKGEMALIGPRPLLEKEHLLIPETDRKLRETLLPGITGAWQTHEERHTRKDWYKIETDYITNWNFTKDIKVLCKTVLFVIKLQNN